jgi:hypothetical protein
MVHLGGLGADKTSGTPGSGGQYVTCDKGRKIIVPLKNERTKRNFIENKDSLWKTWARSRIFAENKGI